MAIKKEQLAESGFEYSQHFTRYVLLLEDGHSSQRKANDRSRFGVNRGQGSRTRRDRPPAEGKELYAVIRNHTHIRTTTFGRPLSNFLTQDNGLSRSRLTGDRATVLS